MTTANTTDSITIGTPTAETPYIRFTQAEAEQPVDFVKKFNYLALETEPIDVDTATENTTPAPQTDAIDITHHQPPTMMAFAALAAERDQLQEEVEQLRRINARLTRQNELYRAATEQIQTIIAPHIKPEI